jgi:hypothetical protein
VPFPAIAFLMILAAFAVLWIGDKITDLVRTLKRIESRLTLLSPLDVEAKTLDRDVLTKASVRDRAIHPDIWISNVVSERGDLRGEEWKKVRDDQRYRERRYRR